MELYTHSPLHINGKHKKKFVFDFLLHTMNRTERIITFEKATGIRKYEQKYSRHTIAFNFISPDVFHN
jgi:hypothetical protein